MQICYLTVNAKAKLLLQSAILMDYSVFLTFKGWMMKKLILILTSDSGRSQVTYVNIYIVTYVDQINFIHIYIENKYIFVSYVGQFCGHVLQRVVQHI